MTLTDSQSHVKNEEANPAATRGIKGNEYEDYVQEPGTGRPDDR